MKVLAFLLVSALFVNCSSDDKKTIKRLIRVDGRSVFWDGAKGYYHSFDLKYSENKLIEINFFKNDLKFLYTYEGEKLKTIKAYDHSSLIATSNFTYIGNLIMTEDGKTSGSPYYHDNHFYTKFYYDSNGFLIKKVKNSFMDDEIGWDSEIITTVFEYDTNGNVIKEKIEEIYDDIRIDPFYKTKVFKYDTKINPLYGIILPDDWDENFASKNNITMYY